MADQPLSIEMLGLTAQIVSAHVSNNPVPPEGLPTLIQDVYRTLNGIGQDAPVAPPPPPEKQLPAVPIKKSVFADYLVCLEDGKHLKMLKRHLASAYNMTPEQYRDKWGLPPEYPMVAPNYAKHRSSLAKSIGLGTKTKEK
jgi:predicted transcriptional regulator